MKIAIDVSPLQTGHKVRGVGFYLSHLKDALLKYCPEHTYYFFTNKSEIPSFADIIHYPYFDPFTRTLPFFSKQKIVVTIHDLTPLVFPKQFPAGIKGQVFWHMQKFALQKVSCVITDSDSSKRDVANYTGYPKNRIKRVYLAAGEEFKPASQEKITAVKKKYHLPDKFVLYVGDVTWNKNVPNIIRSAKELSVPLVLVGKALGEKQFDRTNPWNADKIIIEKLLQNNPQVFNLGFVDQEDLVALYTAASVFVFPSCYEGFGLPLLEAMKCKTPVVTSDNSSLAEVAGNAAYYVDEYNPNSIAKAINHVLTDKSLREKLVAEGITQAKKFSWEQTAKETVEAYKQAL